MIGLERAGPPIDRIFDARAKLMQSALQQLMGRVRSEGKSALRRYIATNLTRRASYLITDKSYEEGLTAFFHSRWMKKRIGPSAGGKLRAADILAAHAQPGGLEIRPVRAQRLIISGARGAARKSVARQLAAFGLGKTKRGGTRLTFPRSTREAGNIVAVFATGARRGRVLATLAQSVRLPQRLDVRQMLQILRGVLARARATAKAERQ